MQKLDKKPLYVITDQTYAYDFSYSLRINKILADLISQYSIVLIIHGTYLNKSDNTLVKLVT